MKKNYIDRIRSIENKVPSDKDNNGIIIQDDASPNNDIRNFDNFGKRPDYINL